jgi:uncharacterized protein
MPLTDYRSATVAYLRANARPVDKYSHQPRLYALARRLGEGIAFDDDVLFAAAWLHDLGVFVGHRPEDPEALRVWDNVAYACAQAPELLRQFGFPPGKIPAVVQVITQHLPSATPDSIEATLLRDADILEQLGAIGLLRTVSKVGRDTRFAIFSDAVAVLRRNVRDLPGQLRLPQARALAQSRVRTLAVFLEGVEEEAGEGPL